jgi:hypothetical protein
VVLDLVDGDLPTENGVTLRAIGAELPQVDVRVAIGAILPDIGENRLGMTFNTSNFFVLPTQGIRGFVVIKLQYRAYRTPSRRGVTVFAWNRQESVRTADITLLSVECRNEQKQPNNEGRSCDEMCVLKRNTPLAPEGRRGWSPDCGQCRIPYIAQQLSCGTVLLLSAHYCPY